MAAFAVAPVRPMAIKEMVVDARDEMVAVGVEFIPIVNYPIGWRI